MVFEFYNLKDIPPRWLFYSNQSEQSKQCQLVPASHLALWLAGLLIPPALIIL